MIIFLSKIRKSYKSGNITKHTYFRCVASDGLGVHCLLFMYINNINERPHLFCEALKHKFVNLVLIYISILCYNIEIISFIKK